MSADDTANYTVKNAVRDDDPTNPTLTVFVDTSETLPGNVKMARTYKRVIKNPTAEQIADFATGKPVILTLAPATA